MNSLLKKDKSQTLKSLSITRWSAKDDAFQVLMNDWEQVFEALHTIAEEFLWEVKKDRLLIFCVASEMVIDVENNY